MKNSVNYSGFLDLVLKSGDEMTSKDEPVASLHVESQSGTDSGESKYIQKPVNVFDEESRH